MNLFFFGAHHDPTLKETNQDGQTEYAGDPNFDESLNQGGEYIDDSLRMTDQPLADE